MGWSGDINVFSRTATYVSNADQFLTRHMYAMRDVQAPSGRFADVAPVGGGFGGVLWGSAGIVVPWETYLQYKDVALLERHYPAMAAYMDYLETTIDPKTGLSSDAQLGDWLGPQNNALGSAFLATAYHAYDLGIMAKVAEILGKPDDAAKYRSMYEKRKAFFNATFVNAEKKTLGTRRRTRRVRRAGRRGRGGASGIQSGRHADFLRGRPGHGFVQRREHALHGQEPGGNRGAREQGRRRDRTPEVFADDGLHRHFLDQQGSFRQRPERTGVPDPAEQPISVVALCDRSGGDLDLGTAQRIYGGKRIRRQQQHELVQPLFLRRRRPMDDGLFAGHSAG